MNYDELLEKYQALLSENNILKEEITKLKTQLCLKAPGANSDAPSLNTFVKLWQRRRKHYAPYKLQYCN